MDLDPLTLPPEELRRLGYRVIDALVAHIEGLRDLPPIRTGSPAELRERLGGPPPDGPGDPDAALDRLLTDALAAATNAFAGSWVGGSGPSALELVVLDWLRGWCGLPEETEGILVSGGSVGSLAALAAARAAVGGDGAVVYCSDQTHASVKRALRILGFGEDRVRVLDTDDAFRLPPDSVGDAVQADRDAGLRPAIVIATAGTTNTGSVDPLAALADLAAEHGMWLHVDGAYGGPAVLTERGRALLAGLDRADSLVLDPHKWLFQPFEIGSVLVRRPGALRRAFAMFPEYLRDVGAGEGEEIAFRDRGPQLSRGSRAMKLWLSMQVFGLDAFRAGIDRCIDLAEHAEALVGATPGFEVVTPAQLAVVTFHARDADNDALAQRVVDDGYTAPSTTVLRGRTVLRMCTINPRTSDDELERSVARIAELAG